jgi:hypothetical protein
VTDEEKKRVEGKVRKGNSGGRTARALLRQLAITLWRGRNEEVGRRVDGKTGKRKGSKKVRDHPVVHYKEELFCQSSLRS